MPVSRIRSVRLSPSDNVYRSMLEKFLHTHTQLCVLQWVAIAAADAFEDAYLSRAFSKRGVLGPLLQRPSIPWGGNVFVAASLLLPKRFGTQKGIAGRPRATRDGPAKTSSKPSKAIHFIWGSWAKTERRKRM